MYLWNILQISDWCNDFYWRYDPLKNIIFIGDVYVAVALRGLTEHIHTCGVQWFNNLIKPINSIKPQIIDIGFDVKNYDRHKYSACNFKQGWDNTVFTTMLSDKVYFGNVLICRWREGLIFKRQWCNVKLLIWVASFPSIALYWIDTVRY